MVDMNISVSEYFRIGLFTILSYIIPSSRNLRIWRKEAWKEGCRGLGGGGSRGSSCLPCLGRAVSWGYPGVWSGSFAVGSWLVIRCCVPILSGRYYPFLDIFFVFFIFSPFLMILIFASF